MFRKRYNILINKFDMQLCIDKQLGVNFASSPSGVIFN